MQGILKEGIAKRTVTRPLKGIEGRLKVFEGPLKALFNFGSHPVRAFETGNMKNCHGRYSRGSVIDGCCSYKKYKASSKH